MISQQHLLLMLGTLGALVAPSWVVAPPTAPLRRALPASVRRATTPACVEVATATRPRGAAIQAAIDGTGATAPVDILVTGINSRCISASIVVEATPAQVWAILTDYDNLATHVPNLVRSDLVPHPSGRIRLSRRARRRSSGSTSARA